MVSAKAPTANDTLETTRPEGFNKKAARSTLTGGFLLLEAGMVRVLYSDNVPVEITAALQPLLEKWSWIVPSICHEIEVFFDAEPEDAGNMMAVALSTEYRRATLFVYGAWLKERKVDRERCVVHELCHVATAQLAECADDMVERFGAEDPKLKAVLLEQVRRACEGVVVDLTQSLLEQRKRRRKS